MLAGHARDAGGEDAVAAQGEEVVVGPDVVVSQCARDDLAHQPFGPVDGPAGFAVAAEIRCGQRGPVELPVDGQRHPLQHDDRSGHHVAGQRLPQRLPDRNPVGVDVAAGADDVGDEPPVGRVAAVLPHDGERLPHPGQRQQGGLDVPEFDPVAADLHLVVCPADELELAVHRAGEVAGAVEPPPGPPYGSATNRAAVRPGIPA